MVVFIRVTSPSPSVVEELRGLYPYLCPCWVDSYGLPLHIHLAGVDVWQIDGFSIGQDVIDSDEMNAMLLSKCWTLFQLSRYR